MGCSPSTLSISETMPVPNTSRNPSTSSATCYRTPPVLHPPPIANGYLLSVDPNSEHLPPDLMNDPDEEEYHVVDRNQFKNASLHKLLETYEFVQPHHFFADVDQDDPNNAPSVAPNTILALNNNNLFDSKPNDDKVVLYITSMRGIRKTYEDCCAINSILDGFRVAVHQRDIAMDLKYRKELQSLLGLEKKAITVPQLFVGTKHVGGADQVRQLQESGELSKLLEGCLVKGSTLVPCICGDARFLMCANCSGSKKIYDEEHRFLRECCHCNENGLVQCPICNT